MKRLAALFAILLVPLLLAAGGFPTTYVPIAPVKRAIPTGRVIGYGLDSTTDTQRGAALAAAVAASAAGDKIFVSADCSTSATFDKEGVRVIVAPGAVITNTGNLPAATPANLLNTQDVICRRRPFYLYCPEPELCLWRDEFGTSADATDTTFAHSASLVDALPIGNGRYHYTAAGGASNSAYLMASRHLKAAQMATGITVADHNCPTGATINDIAVGWSINTTATSNSPQEYLAAVYRRTEANATGHVELFYSKSGVFHTAGVNLTQPLATPFTLILVQNYNSMALAVDEGGSQRILANLEVDVADWNLEDTATIARLRPVIFCQADGTAGQDTTVTDWWVRCMGNLGRREHYTVTYENGEPVRDGAGRYFVTADNCGPSSLPIVLPTPNSAYMRNQSTCHLYDADQGRIVANTAKYSMVSGSRTFGAQQTKIVCDRRTGLWHWYSSKWNDAGPGTGPIHMVHQATRQNPLNGYHVFDNWTTVSFNALGTPFTDLEGHDQYDTDIRLKNGVWYCCGTATNIAASRSAFCCHGNSPTNFTTLDFISSSTDEGTRFWDIGGNLYVATSPTANSVKIMNLSGVTQATLTMPAANRYPHQASLLPRVKHGKTQFQIITFSDTSPGEDFVADFAPQTQWNAEGADLIVNAGEYSGEQFTSMPRAAETPYSIAP